MRDPNRIHKILKELEEAWEKCPDMRLGQLIENINVGSNVIWHVEDDDWIKKIISYKEK